MHESVPLTSITFQTPRYLSILKMCSIYSKLCLYPFPNALYPIQVLAETKLTTAPILWYYGENNTSFLWKMFSTLTSFSDKWNSLFTKNYFPVDKFNLTLNDTEVLHTSTILSFTSSSFLLGQQIFQLSICLPPWFLFASLTL